jgi:RNA polymerase sigma-70 factor (ECF subfamily)
LQNTTADDLDIVLEVLAGNINAFAKIIRKYETRVRGHCLAMLSNTTYAEDAAQEVFIKAYQSLGQFRGNSSFSTWLYRITANRCLDILRKKARKQTESWDALLEKEGSKIESMLVSQPAEESSAEQIELMAKILVHLSEKDRAMLLLREMQGLSYQELADTLGCSIDSVKARLRRARQEISEKLRHISAKENV